MTILLQSPGSSAVRTILVSLLFVAGAATLQGQDTTVSAPMLKVLAEVADVYRTGRPVFLVADYRFPHNVIGHFSTRADAERLKADSGATFGVFGPYVTKADKAPTFRIVSVTIESGGKRVTRKLDPDIDALFLNMSAVDKFMIPYYERVYGPTYAQKLRETITVDIVSRPGCHKNTFPCYDPEGQIIRVLKPNE